MRKYEASARTVEEAIEQGLQELGVGIGDVDVQVVEEGSKGLFGLFGSRLAKVSLTVKDEAEDILGDLIPEQKEEAPEKEEEPAEQKEGPQEDAREEIEEPEAEAAAPRQEKKEAPLPAPVRRVAPKKAEKKPAREEKKTEAEKEPAEEENGAPETREIRMETRPMEKPEITLIPEDQLTEESPAGQAFAFLREVTKLMGVDVSIEMGTDAEGNVYGSMMGDTLGILIGRRGETLDALQYLTSLKVNRGRETYTRVTLDTENYRARREDTLIRLANRMANRAVRTGRRVSLEPMNPYERRIIHYALQQNEAVSTHSEGDEPNRHVVITVKK